MSYGYPITLESISVHTHTAANVHDINMYVKVYITDSLEVMHEAIDRSLV